MNHLNQLTFLETRFISWFLYSMRSKLLKLNQHLLSLCFKKHFLAQTNIEELQLYCLLQFVFFVIFYSDLGRQEILNNQLYITVESYLVSFMKMVEAKQNTYQRE